jgi:ribose 1,5-bisphosphate isomerase
MKSFEQICRAIKEVKIQGAENIAKAAVQALKFRHDKKAVQKLLSLRPTEPCLRNALKFALGFANIEEGIKQTLEHFDYAAKRICGLGEKLIKSGMIVYTHCHSSTVSAVLKAAKAAGKRFEVHITETRPLYQGRLTAAELAAALITVVYFVDSAARIALKKADIMLLGCDAITSTKIYNKIGSELFSIIAASYDIPIYICTDSWKFDAAAVYCEEQIEERPPSEVWKAPQGVRVENPAFEKINPELITAIVSELGVQRHAAFVEQLKKTYPFMFQL